MKLYGYRYDSANEKFFEEEILAREVNCGNYHLRINKITNAQIVHKKKVGFVNVVTGDYWAVYREPSKDDFIRSVKSVMKETINSYTRQLAFEKDKYDTFVEVFG